MILITMAKKRMKVKHRPSGIIIVWRENDGKIHSKSIPADSMRRYLMSPRLYAESELLCLQLEHLTLVGCTKFMPMVTEGLSRSEAKRALKKELQLKYISRGT